MSLPSLEPQHVNTFCRSRSISLLPLGKQPHCVGYATCVMSPQASVFSVPVLSVFLLCWAGGMKTKAVMGDASMQKPCVLLKYFGSDMNVLCSILQQMKGCPEGWKIHLVFCMVVEYDAGCKFQHTRKAGGLHVNIGSIKSCRENQNHHQNSIILAWMSVILLLTRKAKYVHSFI